jgi:hypothetical protein
MEKKESFSLLPFQNGFCSFQNSYIIYYLIKCIVWTLPNIDVCNMYPWKKVNFIISYIPFDSFKMKIIVKTRIQIIWKGLKEHLHYIQFIFGFFY